jgi:ABC-type dipeptide/oligopeptide/nickel transport system ATPase component
MVATYATTAAPPSEAAPRSQVTPLLQVKHLRTHFFTDAGVVKAVEDVSFALNAGDTLAVVGESGSGKSVTSLSIMGLIPNPPGRIVGGEILFRTREGTIVDLAKLPVRALRKLRGRDIAMIFQEPMTSLDPVFTIGDRGNGGAASAHESRRGDETRAANAGACGNSSRQAAAE